MLSPEVVKGESSSQSSVESIGARLKRIREAAGKTQVQVQSALGLGKIALSEYENGKTAPSEDVLERLGEHYGVPVAVLRYGEDVLQSAGADYWAGYADAILGILEDAAARQRRLVQGLRGKSTPLAGGLTREEIAEHVRIADAVDDAKAAKAARPAGKPARGRATG